MRSSDSPGSTRQGVLAAFVTSGLLAAGLLGPIATVAPSVPRAPAREAIAGDSIARETTAPHAMADTATHDTTTHGGTTHGGTIDDGSVTWGAGAGDKTPSGPAADGSGPSPSPRPTDTTRASWDNLSDTWVATDALGRSLPLHADVGPPRSGKFVGIFYFLWLGRHGEAGPFDISRILAADPGALEKPGSPLWGPLTAPHHWGETIFGYYVSDDEGVLRKHAQMLSDAGVDAVIFDVTNQLTYPESWRALCRVFDEVRRAGNRVPQIAFLCPFGDPRKVVRELWDELYGKGLYSELWFRWEGKPLILADPSPFGEFQDQPRRDKPAELSPGGASDQATGPAPGGPPGRAPERTLGQSFASERPFDAVGGSFPTWGAKDSAMTLSLYRKDPKGERLASRRFEGVVDNAWALIELPEPAPPGTYYLEMSEPRGKVGWWTSGADVLPSGQAFSDGQADAGGDRTLRIRLADTVDSRILRFFTFRKPQPDYFAGPTAPGQWGWLEVNPQHAFYVTPGVPEQVTVGVAQNAVDGKLSVLSNPRSHGRSFHEGREPPLGERDFSGRNFAEQWKRALEVDPAFIFITGWNEWIAGRFDESSPFYGDGPVTFVDEFDPEFSRDVEPMVGGHGDSYYYQMVSQIRRFKGARPLAPVSPRPIRIDGRFEDWASVGPEFRDTVGDPVRRDHRGWGKGQRYSNRTGRNDIVNAKVSFDDASLHFYVRTNAPLTPHADPRWMLLFIDADGNPSTGWMGYDFAINRTGVTQDTTCLERHEEPGYGWRPASTVSYRSAGNELEVAIPRPALGIGGGTGRLPPAIHFKWADGILETGAWSDFTLNGDAAPNDRFSYRARFSD